MTTREIYQEQDLPEWLSLRALAAFITRNIPDLKVSPRAILRITEELLTRRDNSRGMVMIAMSGPGLVGVALVSGFKTQDPTACIAVEEDFRERGVEEELTKAVEGKLDKKIQILASPEQGLALVGKEKGEKV